MSLRELYHEMIVDHGKHPRHFGKPESASHCQVGHNPLCGDKLTIYLVVNNDIIERVRFEGVGCAISIASASLMAEAVQGKTLAEVEGLFDSFHHLVTVGTEPTQDIGKLAAFSGVVEFPVRVKCATLAWHTMKAALARETNLVSTE